MLLLLLLLGTLGACAAQSYIPHHHWTRCRESVGASSLIQSFSQATQVDSSLTTVCVSLSATSSQVYMVVGEGLCTISAVCSLVPLICFLSRRGKQWYTIMMDDDDGDSDDDHRDDDDNRGIRRGWDSPQLYTHAVGPIGPLARSRSGS